MVVLRSGERALPKLPLILMPLCAVHSSGLPGAAIMMFNFSSGYGLKAAHLSKPPFALSGPEYCMYPLKCRRTYCIVFVGPYQNAACRGYK